MDPRDDRPVLLVGTAAMGAAYARVLRDALGQPFVAVGRDPERTRAFADREGAAGWCPFEALGSDDASGAAFVIVATAVESLEPVTTRLLDLGAGAVLVEKPGALDAAGALRLAARARRSGAIVRVACNRRFFGSVRRLADHIASGARVRTAHFDFTEWPERVLAAGKAPEVMARLAIANSIHVIDTVSHLLGPLEVLHAVVDGQGALPWHPAGAEFAGVARCGSVPVTWSTSWRTPGRWAIEVCTDAGRHRLAPMEELRIQRPGSVSFETEGDLQTDEDEGLKPGVRRMVAAFARLAQGAADDDSTRLPDLGGHAGLLRNIEKIAGYDA